MPRTSRTMATAMEERDASSREKSALGLDDGDEIGIAEQLGFASDLDNLRFFYFLFFLFQE